MKFFWKGSDFSTHSILLTKAHVLWNIPQLTFPVRNELKTTSEFITGANAIANEFCEQGSKLTRFVYVPAKNDAHCFYLESAECAQGLR